MSNRSLENRKLFVTQSPEIARNIDAYFLENPSIHTIRTLLLINLEYKRHNNSISLVEIENKYYKVSGIFFVNLGKSRDLYGTSR